MNTINTRPSKILIVEDSRLFVGMFKNYFGKELPHELIFTDSEEETLAIIEDQGDEILLAITGLYLPGSDSSELINHLVGKKVPVVVFTSKMAEDIRDQLFAKGVMDYVIKGDKTSILTLVDIVRRLEKNPDHSILVVDDSPFSRKQVSARLINYRFVVYTAESGAQALEVLREHPEIRLIITDHNMPEMTGVELTKLLRGKFGRDKLAIIGLSGNDSRVLSTQFIKAGANDFLTKPYYQEEMYCRVVQNIEILEQTDALKKLNEMKNKFLGIAAHDLRAPLNGINMATFLLTQEGLDKKTAMEMLERIKRISGEMTNLINDLLDVTVIESGNLKLDIQQHSLCDILDKRLEIMKMLASNKKIKINKQISEVNEVMVDIDRIGQVIDNFITNAIKYSQTETEIIISIFPDGEDVCLSVKDQGPGIPEKEIEDLFGEFKKTSVKPTAGEASVGLGLAICKKIVKSHKGTIGVHTEEGEGSTFYFNIPPKED